MKKISYKELCDRMWEHNKQNNNGASGEPISGVIVYKQSNFKDEYSELSRSYRVWSNNRAFQSGMIANSMFGDCLDGSEHGVRLDWYRWEVEYCYMD